MAAKVPSIPFTDSTNYWQQRYKLGGDSGVGSEGILASFKANILNQFVEDNKIKSVIEFGCGDGRQLELANYPKYMGIDVSPVAIEQCNQRFEDTSKVFILLDKYKGEQAELSLSLDVIYHLVEDNVFEAHMQQLFNGATRYVGIYSSNYIDNSTQKSGYILHRKFTSWIDTYAPQWKLHSLILNPHPYIDNPRTGSWSDFYFFER